MAEGAARSGKISCCIVGCTNRHQNTSKSVHFYKFPTKPWEKDKREKWIQAENRKGPDGTRWEPTASSCICSQHFTGNSKSHHPLNPSYLPTIFPDVYKVRQLTELQKGRFHRLNRRSRPRSSSSDDHKRAREHSTDPAEAEMGNDYLEMPKYKDVSTQTDPIIIGLNEDIVSKAESTGTVTVPTRPKMVDKEVSAVDASVLSRPGRPTLLHCSGFHGYSTLSSDESAIIDLAGVTLAVFTLLLSFLPDSLDRRISKENRLLIFLLKMKTGLTYSALRVLFGVHRTTVSHIFKTVLTQLVQSTMSFVFWPSVTSVRATMPQQFKINYPKCRVIIDCSEIRVEQPKEVDHRIYFYSNYKSTFTMKFLIGITPSGMVSFISKCYGGRSSDSSITVDSKILDLLEPGDDVMADKGFPGIKTALEDKHCVIVMPPFLHNGRFSQEEVDETYRIASVRIHVERMIQRVKIYNILQKVPVELFPHIDDIVRMCCVLANLQLPILKNNE